MARVCGGQYLFRDPTGKQQRSSNHGKFFFSSIRCITHFGRSILISIIIDCTVCGCVCYITVGNALDNEYRNVHGCGGSGEAGD